NAIVRIKTVSVVIDVVAQHVQAAANGNRDIRALRKELEQELKQLPASVFVLFRHVEILTFDREIIIDQVGSYQDEMIIKRDGNIEDPGSFFAGFLTQVETALCLDGRAEQSQLELFFE